jgi:AdoMet-dependent heme synthase
MLRVLSAPVFYALELTLACPNRCRGCLNGSTRQTRSSDDPGTFVAPLDFAEWQTVLATLTPHAQRIKLTGGEPTLHPAFASIVRHIDSLGIEFSIFTSGRWTRREQILDTLADARRLTGLLVSLHGSSPASHEAYTGVPGSFEETTDNVRSAVTRGIPVILSTVLTCYNAGELPAIAALAEELGAGCVVFNRYLGTDIPGLTLSPAGLKLALDQVELMRTQGRSVRYGNCIPQCFAPNTSSGCLAGVAYCAVDPWGEVKPCTYSTLRTGNLLRQPLAEVWQASAMEDFRLSIAPACHRCDAFASCHGGCKALALERRISLDPLARPGNVHHCQPLRTLALAPHLRPQGRFKVRTEDWGLILLAGNQVFPLRLEAASLLSMLDGRSSLSEIQARLGPQALSVVGDMYERSLITWV